MKRILTFMLVGIIAFVSCKKEDPVNVPTATAELTLVQSAMDSLVLKLKTQDINKSAYICEPAATAVGGTTEYIMQNGTEIPVENGDNIFTIKNLKPMTEYRITVAVQNIKDHILEEPVVINATTEDVAKYAKAEIELAEAGSDTVKIKVTTFAVKECAYICEPAETAQGGTPEFVFENGTIIPAADGENFFTIKGLFPNRDYKVTLAARIVNDQLIERSVELTFTTGDYEKFATLLEQKYDGYVMHLQLPESITSNDSLAIRYATACLPWYNYLKMMSPIPGAVTDADMLIENGDIYTRESKDVYFDNAHRIYEDPEWGEIELFNQIVPGEPCIFHAGEYVLSESDYGWGEGYYTPKFDYEGYYTALGETGQANEDDYWTGIHHNELVMSKAPQLLDSKLNVEITELTPGSAKIAFKPESGVEQYVVMFLDEEMYELSMMLLGDRAEEYMQWYTTSYFAAMMLGTMSLEGENEVDLMEFFYGLTPGSKIKMLAVGIGNDEGSLQNFQTLDIEIPDYTKPAPVVNVSAIANPEGEEDPYKVWFNVKAPDADLVSAKYVANYTREFDAMFNNGYDEQTLIEERGNEFTPEEVESINSPEGLNLMFTSRADAETKFGSVGYNDEHLASAASYTTNRTIAAPALDPVDSPLFTELKGDWTASATFAQYDYNEEKWIPNENPTTFKINIDNTLAEFPATLTDDIYGLYDMTKEEVDAMYKELQERRDLYNTRLKEQNSLVCTGFAVDKEEGSLDYQSPYDLFISTTYSGYDIEALFYDFGPKFSMQIHSDGTVTIPVNINFLDPLANWHKSYGFKDVFYLVPTGETSFIGGPVEPSEPWPNIPVSISEDKNTITIKALVAENNEGVEETYYPNVLTQMNGQFKNIDCGKIISEITLTRGWTEPAPAATVKSSRKSFNVPMTPEHNFVYKPATVPTSRTGFTEQFRPINKVMAPARVSKEQIKDRLDAMYYKMYSKR